TGITDAADTFPAVLAKPHIAEHRIGSHARRHYADVLSGRLITGNRTVPIRLELERGQSRQHHECAPIRLEESNRGTQVFVRVRHREPKVIALVVGYRMNVVRRRIGGRNLDFVDARVDASDYALAGRIRST